MKNKNANPGRAARRVPTPPPFSGVCPEVRAAIRYREQLGLSQQTFAEEFGMSFYTYRQWESGDREPGRAGKMLLRLIVMVPNDVRRAALMPLRRP